MGLDPDVTSRAPATHTAVPPPALAGPNALQILTTEHWSLLASRSMGYTEAMSRAAIFVAALSGAVVSLALVAQATDFGSGFVAFALVLLPVVYFVGLTTLLRIAQVNFEDALWVQGMNRLRNAYLELEPELEPYFVTSKYDDAPGILRSTLGRPDKPGTMQLFVAIPGVVAVVDSVVAGATVGIASYALDLGLAGSLALGAVGFVLSLTLFAVWAERLIAQLESEFVTRFPSPPA
jgi:hypothetical protein